jgi:hypothetical protein
MRTLSKPSPEKRASQDLQDAYKYLVKEFNISGSLIRQILKIPRWGVPYLTGDYDYLQPSHFRALLSGYKKHLESTINRLDELEKETQYLFNEEINNE